MNRRRRGRALVVLGGAGSCAVSQGFGRDAGAIRAPIGSSGGRADVATAHRGHGAGVGIGSPRTKAELIEGRVHTGPPATMRRHRCSEKRSAGQSRAARPAHRMSGTRRRSTTTPRSARSTRRARRLRTTSTSRHPDHRRTVRVRRIDAVGHSDTRVALSLVPPVSGFVFAGTPKLSSLPRREEHV